MAQASNTSSGGSRVKATSRSVVPALGTSFGSVDDQCIATSISEYCPQLYYKALSRNLCYQYYRVAAADVPLPLLPSLPDHFQRQFLADFDPLHSIPYHQSSRRLHKESHPLFTGYNTMSMLVTNRPLPGNRLLQCPVYGQSPFPPLLEPFVPLLQRRRL